MTCLQEQGYLPAKSQLVVSIQPAERYQQQHNQDQLEAYLKAPIAESVQCDRHKDKLVVHHTHYKCEKGSSFCCSNWLPSSRFTTQTLRQIVILYHENRYYDTSPDRLRCSTVEIVLNAIINAWMCGQLLLCLHAIVMKINYFAIDNNLVVSSPDRSFYSFEDRYHILVVWLLMGGDCRVRLFLFLSKW